MADFLRIKRIVCFGDSNTHGYNAENGGRFGESIRWPCVLQRLLGAGYRVVEEGMNGRTAAFEDPEFEGRRGMDYIVPCMMSHKPVSLLIVMLGTNDLNPAFGAHPKTIAEGVGLLLQKALPLPAWDEKPNILLISPPVIRGPGGDALFGPGAKMGERSRMLAGYYRKVAEKLPCAFLDAGAMEVHPLDGTHLTPAGHRALAGLLAPKVRALTGEGPQNR
mgnify:FL=1